MKYEKSYTKLAKKIEKYEKRTRKKSKKSKFGTDNKPEEKSIINDFKTIYKQFGKPIEDSLTHLWNYFDAIKQDNKNVYENEYESDYSWPITPELSEEIKYAKFIESPRKNESGKLDTTGWGFYDEESEKWVSFGSFNF